MRTVRFALYTFLAACSTSTAWAQYGLYGSPETLSMPQQEATQSYPATANYPTTAPMTPPVPTPATTRVVQMLPGPIPTLTASAPARARAR